MHERLSSTLNLAALACLTLLVLSASGCRDHLVQTTVINQSTTTVRNIEVDYPSASFGISSLPPGGQFAYHFKIEGTGDLQLIYVDSAEHSHTVKGPYIAEGQEGTLQIRIGNDKQNVWQMQLKPEVTAPKE
ncbi:MAG TPA: hypothetical protein VHX63_08045 [Acidobacteriaceae bacterium]|jgi:hypothetical protein|nr:hypothetical protein [Acidobacteriaceae bacterium]